MTPDFTNIKNIIFDLGNVILNLDIEETVNTFTKMGLNSEAVDKKYDYVDPIFYELETGMATPEEFRSRLRQIMRNPEISDNQIDDAWYAMIRDTPPERIEILKKLKKKFNIYLFSNANKIHMDRFHRRFKSEFGFEFSSLFVQDFYSYKIHSRKPDLDSYRKVIEISAVNPGETLFVDDLEPNIIAAGEAGLKIFWLKQGMEMADFFNPNIIAK